MLKKFGVGVLGLILLILYWAQWEEGKQVAALQNQARRLEEKMGAVELGQNNLAGALVELIRRTGHTNMIRGSP